MFVFKAVIVACALIVFNCDAGIVDTLPKCSIKDEKCLKESYEAAVKRLSAGDKDLGIPTIDPLEITDLTVPLLDDIKVTISDGTVKGIGNCRFKSFHIDIEGQTGAQEILCDVITVKGQILAKGSSAILQSLFGVPSIDGNGTGKLKIENMYINFTFPFYPIKKDDGNIYFKVLYKDIKYGYDIGKATFGAEKIIIGKEDISELVVGYLNENFDSLRKTFGKVFIDEAMNYYFEFAQKFFEFVPVNNYIIEDLTPYVKN